MSASRSVRDRDEHVLFVRARDERAKIDERAVVVRRLHVRAEHVAAELRRRRIAEHDRDAERLRASLQHLEHLRIGALGHPERISRRGSLASLHAMQQRHRFAGGGRLVQQRRRRDLHRRQIAHHRLEIEERLEAPLRDFRLIRRVGRVPRRILEQVPKDHARRDRAVVAHADERLEPLVLRRHRAQPIQILVLGFGRRQLQRLLQPDACRQRRVNQARRASARR